jgi:hypothetical protein
MTPRILASAALPSAPSGKAPPSFFRKHGAKLVASVIITVGMVFTLAKGGIKFWPDGGSWATIESRWYAIPLYAASLVAMNYFRAIRWRYLLRAIADVPKRKILSVSWIGFAAILLMPFRIGEFVRPYMIRDHRDSRIDKDKPAQGISIAAATGTILAERVVDGLYLSIILVIAYLSVPMIHPIPKEVVGLRQLHVTVADVRASGYAMFGIFTTASIVITIFYFAREWARKATLLVIGIVSKKLAEKLASFAEKLADGLHFLGRPRDAIPFLFETSVYWFLNVGGMWLLAWGCGVVHADGSPVTFGETCALMGTLSVTILIPGPPGLFGVFQLGIFAGLTMYFPESIVSGEGAAYVFIMYALQFTWTLVGGAIFLIGDRQALRELEEAEGVVPPTPPVASELERATN